jgi:heme exporter protein D
VNTAAVVIGNLGAYDWNARVYDTLALASRLAASVRDRANVLRIAYHLRELNKGLVRIREITNAAMEGKIKPNPNAEPVTRQTLRSNADNFEQMYRTLEYLLESLRRAGLANNSLTAASFRGLEGTIEPIANLADWFDVASQPEEVGRLFDRAKKERESGELIDLAQVE